MSDGKPKHKPQKKRALEEVLKSLQDLIRTDLANSQATHKSLWASTSADPASPVSAEEPDTLRDALHKLDKIIAEKIIEPVQRAEDTPPEPLLPDEELEIRWDDSREPGQAISADNESPPDAVEMMTSDTALGSPEEIEIEALPPDETPSAQPTVESQPREPAESSVAERLEQPPVESAADQTAPETITELQVPAIDMETVAESIDLEAVESVEPPPQETIALADTERTIETADGQGAFDFVDAEQTLRVEPVPEHPPESAAPTGSTLQVSAEPEIPAPVESSEPAIVSSFGETTSDKISAGEEASVEAASTPEEQPNVPAVESSSISNDDEFSVEFTVEPNTPVAADSGTLEVVEAASPPEGKAGTVDANLPPEEPAVKKKSHSPDLPDIASKDRAPSTAESDQKPTAPGAQTRTGKDEIPVLKDVADLEAPPSPPLPDASQARDIAIRVIARLNIERRKAGEPQLDIKIIERLQQYLADALSKRALNKLK